MALSKKIDNIASLEKLEYIAGAIGASACGLSEVASAGAGFVIGSATSFVR